MADHHSGLTTRDVWYALVRLVEVWEKAGCDCCAPTPLDEALGDMDSVPGLAERVRSVGIDMAQAGQWGVERRDENAASDEPQGHVQQQGVGGEVGQDQAEHGHVVGGETAHLSPNGAEVDG